MATELQKNGGPAFPRSENGYGSQIGMSLRDWFAGHALVGCLAYSDPSVNGTWQSNSNPDGLAKFTYQVADAMLKARDAR